MNHLQSNDLSRNYFIAHVVKKVELLSETKKMNFLNMK